MDGTIIQQGSFVSTGNAQFIPLRSSADWFRTYNDAVIGSSAAGSVGYQFYWQRGMAAGTGYEYANTAGSNVLNLKKLTVGGFTWYDTTAPTLGPTITGGATSDVGGVNHVVSNLHGLVTGDIVRLSEVTGAEQLGGYEALVTYIDDNTFALTNFTAIAVASTQTKWQKVTGLTTFAPGICYITKITKDANALVTFAKPHTYTVGQQIRFSITSEFGMPELEGLTGNVLSVPSASTLTVDIDTNGFTAFAFPAVASYPFTPSCAIAMGEGLYSPDPITPPIGGLTTLPHDLYDATYNTAQMGMYLAAGADSPAGRITNKIYWIAGKSFNI